MVQSGRIKVGLLGAGGITAAHIAGFKNCEDRAVVTAIADPRHDVAKARSEALGGAEIYSSWEELIENADVDALDICLPHHLHHPAAMAGIRKGLHILTEKPIARTLDEADEMIQSAEQAGLVLMVCHNRRWIPEIAKLKEMIEQQVIGRVLSIRMEKNGGPGFNHQGIEWVARKETLGGGAMVSDLIHEMDLLRWLGGTPKQVLSASVQVPEWMEGEVVGTVMVRFESGAVGEAAINWAARGVGTTTLLPHASIRVTATEGMAVYSHADGLQVLKASEADKGFQTIVSPSGVSGHEQAIPHFIDAIRQRFTPLTSGVAGRGALEIAMAAYKSEAEAQAVSLPLEKPYFSAI